MACAFSTRSAQKCEINQVLSQIHLTLVCTGANSNPPALPLSELLNLQFYFQMVAVVVDVAVRMWPWILKNRLRRQGPCEWWCILIIHSSIGVFQWRWSTDFSFLFLGTQKCLPYEPPCWSFQAENKFGPLARSVAPKSKSNGCLLFGGTFVSGPCQGCHYLRRRRWPISWQITHVIISNGTTRGPKVHEKNCITYGFFWGGGRGDILLEGSLLTQVEFIWQGLVIDDICRPFGGQNLLDHVSVDIATNNVPIAVLLSVM